jgi:hypothetical protein
MSDSRNSTRNNNIEEDNAKFDLINGIVNRAGSRATPAERNAVYSQNLPKVPKFSLEDCIEQVLNGNNSNNEDGGDHVALRSFETVDFDALTRGFEPEEVKDGKLVLYITENQLLQLLKQRAIIVPNAQKKAISSHDFSRNTLSLVDENVGDRLGAQSAVKELELVVEDPRSRAASRLSTSASQRPQSGRPSTGYNADGDCNEEGESSFLSQ